MRPKTLSHPARGATSFVAAGAYALGLATWIFGWWHASFPVPGVRGGIGFTLFLLGAMLVCFGHANSKRAGATVMQLATVMVCAVAGLGVWGVALLRPAGLMPDAPLAANFSFTAFLIGAIAMSSAGNAARAMAGRD